MRILKLDKKNNYLELIPESMDDLWVMERILENGDLINGKSERKLKGSEGRKAEKIPIFAEISLENIEFHKHTGILRANGQLIRMKPEEFFSQGAFHSIEIELGKKVGIKKAKLKNYQIDRLQKAVEATKKPKITLLILDDEQATISVLREFGIEKKAEIKTKRKGKYFKQKEEKTNEFFEKIIKVLNEINPEKLIIAGPGFTKNDLKKYFENKRLKFKALFEPINSVGITGLNELLKSGIIEKIVKENQLAKEEQLMEKVFVELKKENGLIVYGKQEVKKAVNATAVQELLVTDELLLNERDEIEKLMEKVDADRGEIHIVSSENEAGQKLKGLTGIIAFLRFKIN